tara:strand:- start:2442 stop:3002 length:561 start_codon:yes stop_codon:yes gene_type:complete
MHKKIPQKYYFIKNFDKSNIDKQDNNTSIIYRNYSKKSKKKEILKIKVYCKRKGLKFLISNDIKLAIKLDLDGIYLPSFNKNLTYLNFNLKNDFLIAGSAHNLKEIRIKELQKVNLIFLSSIFKKNKNYLGLHKFKNISKFSNKKIIALGGISETNIKTLKLTDCYGFSGISYFKKKAPKKGPFLI